MTDTNARSVAPRLQIGISSCLLGEEVRYDGGHRKDDFVLSTFGRFVDWVPVCPEVEMGLGVPRETLRLEGDSESPRLVTARGRADHTEKMLDWACGRLSELRRLDLDGYILKKNSPSCGLFRVKVYDANGSPRGTGRGIFAGGLTDKFPLLPVEEEGRLRNPILRENYIDRIFAFHRLRALSQEDAGAADLVAFHASHKLTLMAHHPAAQRELGRLVADAGNGPFAAVRDGYRTRFMEAMAVHATRGKHSNVLQHLMGFLKDDLDGPDKAELLGLIGDYRRGLVPLIVPITLLKHHLSRRPVPEWVERQVYLNPYPKELLLRNHV